MERATLRAIILASVATAALMGCEKAADDGGPTEGAPVSRAETSVRLVDRDVEAPQVFQVSDQALWDGRPSLGGVWVASPDAVDPERVILRNPENGKFVIGALFRRERINPGPTLQISSDAAAALGILAGQPSKLNVTALRREDADAAPATDATKPILDANEAVGTDALASAEAAIDRAEGKPVAADGPVADPAVAEAAVLPDAAQAAAVVPEKPARKGWLFGRKKRAAAADAVVTPVAGAATGAVTGAVTGTVTGPAIETATLPAGGSAAGARPVPVAAVAPARPAAPKAAAPKAAASGGAMIQIGIFSVAANADRAVKLLTGKGIAARKLTEQSQGKTFWRVVADAPDRAATLVSVKAAGFADAYPVSR